MEISNINQLSTLNKATIFKQYIYLHWLCPNLWLSFKTPHRIAVTDYTHILLILTAIYRVMARLCLDLRMNNGCFLVYFNSRYINYFFITDTYCNQSLSTKKNSTLHCVTCVRVSVHCNRKQWKLAAFNYYLSSELAEGFSILLLPVNIVHHFYKWCFLCHWMEHVQLPVGILSPTLQGWIVFINKSKIIQLASYDYEVGLCE